MLKAKFKLVLTGEQIVHVTAALEFCAQESFKNEKQMKQVHDEICDQVNAQLRNKQD